jgi:flagella basal body P-ring formation protein FlgA
VGANAEVESTSFDLEQLNQAVSDYLAEQYPADGQIEISVNRLDPRLRLSPCELPLQFTLRDSGSRGGKVSIHTRCTGNHPWALYISADVKMLASVVVANRNIPKGTILSLSDFDTQIRDTATMNGYALDATNLLGKSAARTIRTGEAMYYALVSEPIAVKRGDAVVVEAQSGTIVVSTQAIALADGRVGEQISVRNMQSERIVRIEIMGPGRGRVIL